jgi:hypothetical protein
MRWLKNPMANAVYVALITAIYAAIFIVSSEFVMSYENLLSDSGWASFIISQNMKFVGIGMIGVAIIVDTLSALRRKRYDEYQIVLLEKVFLFNGLFTAVSAFVGCTYTRTDVFCRNHFCANPLSMGSYGDHRTIVSNHQLQSLIKAERSFDYVVYLDYVGDCGTRYYCNDYLVDW